MEVLLDTSFIVSCVMKRIDFLEELEKLGFTPKVPKEVMQEMKDLKTKEKTSRKEREAIGIAFQMLEAKKVKKANLGGGNVDDGLISKGSEGIYIATLDRGVKMRVPNKVVIDNSRKSLKIVRD